MKSKKFLMYLNTGIFIIVLAILGILFFILPHKNTSDFEKRKLAKMPEFSLDSLFEGNYMAKLDKYFADHFPFRDKFVELSFQLAESRGLKSEEVAFYDTKVNMNPIEERKQTKKNEFDDEDDGKLEDEEEELKGEVGTISRGILVYNGMAMQMFGGTPSLVKGMGDVINLYHRKLNDTLGCQVQVYSVVAPTHAAIYLPKSYTDFTSSEAENIDSLHAYLDDGIIGVNPSNYLKRHKKEYIYFNSDHHWTGRGAYYAYRAFCRKAGLKAVPLKKMTRRVIPDFLGSLYWITRDKRLKEKGDSVEYFKPKIKYKTYVLTGENYEGKYETKLFWDNVKGGNAYSVYLGADNIFIRVDTEKKNGRKVLIIKNSYGNPFSPYLVAHFEQVFIADYRYFKGNLKDFVKKNQITDVIVFNNTFSANTYPDMKQYKKALGE